MKDGVAAHHYSYMTDARMLGMTHQNDINIFQVNPLAVTQGKMIAFLCLPYPIRILLKKNKFY